MAAETMSSNQQINSVVVNEKNNNDFVYYAISRAFPRYLSEVGVQAVPILSKSNFEKLPNYTTSRNEQDKIGYFLNLLDERIATQNKIIEDLKKLKSAIIDLLFCSPKEEYPRKRVTGFSDAWGLVKLSDICDRITTKNSESTCSLVLTVAAQYGLVSQLDFFNKSVASENLESYYLLEKGDFAYNKSYSSDYSWGAVKRLDLYPQGVLSPLYICFRPNPSRIDSDYLALYFESRKWHKGIADIAGEGARNHGLLNISVGDFFETKHRIPSLAEQRKIATILNGLTAKISHNQALLTAFVQQRKYMLAKMFI